MKPKIELFIFCYSELSPLQLNLENEYRNVTKYINTQKAVKLITGLQERQHRPWCLTLDKEIYLKTGSGFKATRGGNELLQYIVFSEQNSCKITPGNGKG